MLMDKQISPSLPRKKSFTLGWIERGTAVPHALRRLLEDEGHTLLLFGYEESMRQEISLAVLDCRGLDDVSLQKCLAGLHAQDAGMRIALWGLDAKISQERLIRWPGVKGIFCADCDELQLRKGVQSLLSGENWLPRKLLDGWLEQQRSRLLPALSVLSEPLTDRERQILGRVSDANTNAQIAYDLCISEHTVKTHLYNIYRKIKVRNRTEACNWIKANMQMAGS